MRTDQPPAHAWRPIIIPADQEEELQRLIGAGHVWSVHDTLSSQLAELGEEVAEPDRHGNQVYFPWSGRLVHLLPVEQFRRVRTDRNRGKITRGQQQALGRATIGIVGLSVGQTAALTLALEGIGGRLRLADFDALSLSNLNRVRGGVHELGIPKCVLAARAIAELDPYLDVEILPEGISADNLGVFLAGLDLLIEECDDLAMKLLLREHARARRLPVIMDTSDRGLIDVERFDREPDRPVLHGLVGDLRAEELVGLSTADKVPYVFQILGEETLSDGLAASLPEVRRSLSTWPQLGSAVTLGGAVVADTARRILLGTFNGSGRYWVDLEALIAEGRGGYEVAPSGPPAPAPLRGARRKTPCPNRPDVATVKELVGAATLAPTGHNAQAWRFELAASTLTCALDTDRLLPALDFEGVGAWAGLGAASLNLELAAREAGVPVELSVNRHGFQAELHRAPPEDDPLRRWIAQRATNRRPGVPAALGPAHDCLLSAARTEGCTLRLATSADALVVLGEAVGAVDRITWLLEPTHRAITHGLRWTPEQVDAHRDGLDVACLDLSPAGRAGLRLISRWSRAARLAEGGLGSALTEAGAESVCASSAIGLLEAPGHDTEAGFRGGRAMQRMWLEATRLGLGFHPIATLPSLLARKAAGRMSELGTFPGLEEDLDRAERAFRQIFPRQEGVEVMLFRVTHAAPPGARSVRRPVESVLRIR